MSTGLKGAGEEAVERQQRMQRLTSEVPSLLRERANELVRTHVYAWLYPSRTVNLMLTGAEVIEWLCEKVKEPKGEEE